MTGAAADCDGTTKVQTQVQVQTLKPAAAATANGGGSAARAGARSLLLVALSRFYSVKSNMTGVLPYISGETPNVSLRLIDWFVTNYSKKHNVVLAHEHANHTVVHFNVYLNYRSQLKAYSKQQFDPFRRRDRILFHYSAGCAAVETTVGQLNFFRWMLQNKLLDYIDRNAAAIEADMVGSQRLHDQGQPEQPQVEKAAPGRGRRAAKSRCELSQQCSAAMSMTRVAGALTVAFE
jgi:hypothetical protein